MVRFIFSLSLLGSFCVYAQPKPATNDDLEAVYFNLGTHTEFYNQVQNDASGGLRKFDLAPTIGAGLVYPLASNWSFTPELNWVLPRPEGDFKIIKNLWMLRADLSYDWLYLKLRAGTSLMWLNMQGRGGTAEIRNGDTTSTFYYPAENRSSINNTLDLGAELKHDNWALRFQTYTYSLFRAERRQLSYTLFLTYYWER